MYFLALFTALLVGTFAQDPILPNNNWLHYLGKKNSLFDPLITPILPFDLSKFEILSRRSAFDWLFPDNETLLQWIHTLGKKSVLLDPLIPINDTILQWIHKLGKKSVLLDPLINQLLPINLQWINLLGKRDVNCVEDPLLSINPQWMNLLGKRDASCVEDPLQAINPLWINLLGKRDASWSDIVKGNIDWIKLQPLLSSKKRDIVDDPFSTFNPLILSKKGSDLLSNPFLLNPITIGGKKRRQSIFGPVDVLGQLVNEHVGLSLTPGKKRRQGVTATNLNEAALINNKGLLEQVLGKRQLESFIKPIENGPSWLYNSLIDLIASRGNLDSLFTKTDLGIIPFKPNRILSKTRRQSIVSPTYILGQTTGHYPLIDLILSKKRRQSIVSPTYILGQPTHHSFIDLIASKRNIESITGHSGTVYNGIIPFNTNLILSKKRDVIFDPLNTNPLIISKKRDVVFDPLNTNPLIISKKRDFVFDPLHPNVVS